MLFHNSSMTCKPNGNLCTSVNHSHLFTIMYARSYFIDQMTMTVYFIDPFLIYSLIISSCMFSSINDRCVSIQELVHHSGCSPLIYCSSRKCVTLPLPIHQMCVVSIKFTRMPHIFMYMLFVSLIDLFINGVLLVGVPLNYRYVS